MMRGTERVEKMLVARGFTPAPHPHYRGFQRCQLYNWIAVWGPIGMMLQRADDMEQPTKQYSSASEFIKALTEILEGEKHGKQAEQEP